MSLKIIPGITAAVSGAAVLGAPIGHDFCVISLSDRLTPWEVIEKRLSAAADGEFLYCHLQSVKQGKTRLFKARM